MVAITRGLQASVRNNYTAFGYSVMITSSFGAVSTELSRPDAGDVFLFMAGAIAAFIGIEVAVSRGFRRTPRGEPAKVVALGAAFGLGSAGVAVGAATLLSTIAGGRLAWLFASFAASGIYVLLSGVEIALAEWIERRRDA